MLTEAIFERICWRGVVSGCGSRRHMYRFRAVFESWIIIRGVSGGRISSARIVASSLLGGYVLEISPGSNEEMMQDGDIIYDTTDPVSLTDLLGKFVFQSANK